MKQQIHPQTTRKKLSHRLFLLLAMVGWLCLLCAGWACGGLHNPTKSNFDAERGLGPCTQDSDCMGGQKCFLRYCQGGDHPKGHLISLHFAPPSITSTKSRSNTLTTQQFVGLDAAFVHKGKIWLRPAHAIQGIVQTSKSKTQIAARLRFTALEGIQGHSLFWEAETNALTSIGRFSIRLSYGNYRVEIFPKDKTLPIYRIDRIRIEDKPQRITLALPELNEHIRVKGRIVTQDKQKAPLEGAHVQLLSGRHWPISNLAKTNENGEFSILLPPQVEAKYIRIAEHHKAPVHPQVVLPYNEKSNKPVVDLGTMNVGYGGQTVRLFGTIRSAQQEGGQPVANCQLKLHGTIQLGLYQGQAAKGTYQINASSNTNGEFELYVPPGEYNIEVLPPANSTWAKGTFAFSSRYNNPILGERDVLLPLKSKPKLQGIVCKDNKSPGSCEQVKRTQIRAIWRSPLKASNVHESSMSHYVSQAVQPNGEYELSLDPGRYDLVFIPPPDLGLARSIYENVEIQASNPNRKQTCELDAYLPEAIHFLGRVMGPDKFPLANTNVEIYSYDKESKFPAMLLGRATTNSQGEFSVAYSLKKNKTIRPCR